jgi:GTP-binding protein Era
MNGEAGITRCGYVAIVGAPNAGKSTLVNAMVGTKVSIVSPKVQTTRFRVLGIVMNGATQIILVDTPGIFAPKRRLDRAMVAAAWDGAADADVVCLLVDVHRGWDDDSREICARLKAAGRQAVLVLNKVDLVRKDTLLALAATITAEGIFTETYMVSATKEDGVADLLASFAAKLPEGPFLFPEDQISDLPQRLLATEITREKAFLQLHQELPYALTVETEQWQERDDGSVRVDQIIYVQRESQKAIVVGKGGHQIKAIGAAARVELEALLERRVHLFLHVKVKEDWADKRGFYSGIGLEFDV